MKWHRLKYPKIILLIATFILAYIIFTNNYISSPISGFLDSKGYLGSFLAGILFSYGFTAAPAIAIFLILAKSQPPIITALLGGLGSLIGNLLIFHITKSSLNNEITQLEHEKEIVRLEKSIPYKIRKHLLLVIAGFILASPLPDEFAVSLFAASHKISLKMFCILSYVFHAVGIFIIILIGTQI